MSRRRTAYYFTVPSQSNGKVKVLAYSASTALELVRGKYPDARPIAKAQLRPRQFRSVNLAAVRRLAREWGITWPVHVSVTTATQTHGTCRTNFDRQEHRICLSRLADNPERTLRHELGHALDNEQRFAIKGSGRAVVQEQRISKRAMGYHGCRQERAARSMEQRDLHVKLTA